MEKKNLNLKPTITSVDFVYKVYLMELVILEVSLNGNVYNFQLIKYLLINLSY